MSELKIITTSDGSHSLLQTALNETYHSVHGAIQESRHVFIHAGLDPWREQNPNKEIRILEMGFGTGLNVFLTALHTLESCPGIYYESLEVFPLTMDIVRQLNYPTVLGLAELFARIHDASWDEPVEITPSFMLHKRHEDVLRTPFDKMQLVDLIFYDAFAPSKQPELWTMEILTKVASMLKEGGLFVTYCAKGQVKRDLTSLGLKVETLPGPPGKKEMIRATR